MNGFSRVNASGKQVISRFKRLNYLPSCVLLAMNLLLAISSSAQKTNNSNEQFLESGHAAKLTPTPRTPAEFSIITYNIRWRTGAELKQISDWLKEVHPTVIALQEVDRDKERTAHTNNARVLAESLGMYYAWTAPPQPMKDSTGEEETGVELLSPYPFEAVTRLVLPYEGTGGRRRVALGATIKIADMKMRVYSVHAETRIPVPQKIDQLRAVIEDLSRYPKAMPAIVMGDFNSWELPSIEGIQKLFSGKGFSTPFSNDGPTFKRKAIFFDIELKLDWIWLRGFSARTSEINRKLTVSDHYPLRSVAGLG